MYSEIFASGVRAELDDIREGGRSKIERRMDSPQGASVVVDGRSVLNFCANNYLGLANHPAVVTAARDSLDTWGFGMASVRFISGTQSIHRELEDRISALLGTEATILFPSCFDANGAVFETLLTDADAVISDALNHASIIDGIRLAKASKFRYANRDLADLKQQLENAVGARRRIIVTDGVFSMDGYYAPLPEICELAEQHDALVMVDDSHAVGFVGETGAGTPELFGVRDRVDLVTGTLGKALGGASGGYVSGRADLVAILRERGRPYLFSNAVPPSAVAGAIAALDLVTEGADDRDRLWANARQFRAGMASAGFRMLEGRHAIVPVMFDDEHESRAMADALFERGVYATAFSFPVVPIGLSRIRIQLSSAHSTADIDACIAAFVSARDSLK